MDYEKIAANAVQSMSTADLHRFLVVCALISDLYCPGYDPKQSLAKDSNLALTAARYKIETAKVIGQVRAELAEKTRSNGAKHGTKAVSPGTVRAKTAANRK